MKKNTLKIILAIGLMAFSFSVFADPQQYSIIVDAGSSGSRVHVFRHNTNNEELRIGFSQMNPAECRHVATCETLHSYWSSLAPFAPEIVEIFSGKNSFPLASYENNPQEAGASLKKLLDDAAARLISDHIDASTVSIDVLGTGGMRVLPTNKQQIIYDNVSSYIRSHYSFAVNTIETISGAREGLYDWLDVNYLAQNFQEHRPTVGAIDIGGASTQIAFATNDTSRPNDEQVVRVAGQSYRVFSKSFLGLGQDQARAAINNEAGIESCYPTLYPFNQTTFGSFSFSTCSPLFTRLIQENHVVENMLPLTNQHFIAFSGAFYTYNFLGANSDPSQASLENRIQQVCTKPWDVLQRDYPSVAAKYLSTYCANGVFIGDLLYGAYQLHGSQLTVTDKINGQSVDWTLGAMLFKLRN